MYDREKERENFNPKDKLLTLEENKKYLEVQWRIVWFRMENPTGRIITEIQPNMEKNYAIATARIFIQSGNRLICISTGTACKMQDPNDTNNTDEIGKNFIECAETAAIGRALAGAGYGTAACLTQEPPEPTPQQTPAEKNVVDAPVNPKTSRKNSKKTEETSLETVLKTPINVGQYKGRTFGDIIKSEPSYINWLMNKVEEGANLNAELKSALACIKDNMEILQTEQLAS